MSNDNKTRIHTSRELGVSK